MERRATIVYAKYRGKYKICIEVTPQFEVRQALGPSNSKLSGDALEAFIEWCDKKDIRRTYAFGHVRGAPRQEK